MDLEYRGGKGLWREYVNPQTGESTIQYHKPKTINHVCSDGNHYFELSDPRSREIICKKCGLGKIFNIAYYELQDGKLIKRKK